MVSEQGSAHARATRAFFFLFSPDFRLIDLHGSRCRSLPAAASYVRPPLLVRSDEPGPIARRYSAPVPCPSPGTWTPSLARVRFDRCRSLAIGPRRSRPRPRIDLPVPVPDRIGLCPVPVPDRGGQLRPGSVPDRPPPGPRLLHAPRPGPHQASPDSATGRRKRLPPAGIGLCRRESAGGAGPWSISAGYRRPGWSADPDSARVKKKRKMSAESFVGAPRTDPTFHTPVPSVLGACPPTPCI
jgi:hypothetical protein